MNPVMLSIEDVNEGAIDDLTARLGHLFEHSPWIVESALTKRPFTSRRDVHRALCKVVQESDDEQKLALIRAHPDLVGRAADEGTLSSASMVEQAAAGLIGDALSPEGRVRFRTYNAEYARRFGFPFVICARENRKTSILAGFETRLPNERDTEISAALVEVQKIAWYRLVDILEE